MDVALDRTRLDRSLGALAVTRLVATLGCALIALVLPACAAHGDDDLALGCTRLEVAPPLPAPELTLQVAGETFDIVRAGPATAEVVFLLQGFPDGSYDYRAALPRLSNAGYRAIVAVRRGASADPTAVAVNRAQQALALADALALNRFHVAGGELAWELARLAPQRVISIATTPPAQIAAIAALERSASTCSGVETTR